jgi:hypothetical protein
MNRVTLNSPASFFTKMQDEWQQSQRLRIGVMVVVAIFWLYGILVLRDTVGLEREAWQAAEAQNTRARLTATSADWVTRSQDVVAAISEHEQLLWRDGSLGLSQAGFQEQIAQSFSSANIAVRSPIRVAAVADSPVSAELADIVPLRARVQIEFRPTTFYPWLAIVAKARAEKRAALVIDSLTIRAGTVGQPSNADIEFVGYALKTSAVNTAPTNKNDAATQKALAK